MADENTEIQPSDGAQAKPASPWLPIIVILVALPIISIVVTKFVLAPMMHSGAKTEEHADAGHGKKDDGHGKKDDGHGKKKGGHGKKGGGPAVYAVENVVSNVGGTRQSRFVRVSFSVEGSSASFVDDMTAKEARIRDSALSVLSTLTIEDLDQRGLKNIIRANMISAINESLKPAKAPVKELYFSEFVVQ